MLTLIKVSRRQFYLLLTAHYEGQVQITGCQLKSLHKFLEINFDELLIYDEKGQLDQEASALD